MSLNVGVIGAGAMGTAISQCIAPNTNKLLLYARRKEICDENGLWQRLQSKFIIGSYRNLSKRSRKLLFRRHAACT